MAQVGALQSIGASLQSCAVAHAAPPAPLAEDDDALPLWLPLVLVLWLLVKPPPPPVTPTSGVTLSEKGHPSASAAGIQTRSRIAILWPRCFI